MSEAITFKSIYFSPRDVIYETVSLKEIILIRDVSLGTVVIEGPTWALYRAPKEEEILREYREISIDELKKAMSLDEEVIRQELEELLDSYGVPNEYIDTVISCVKKELESEIGDLPYKDKLLELLSKLYIHLAYKLLMFPR